LAGAPGGGAIGWQPPPGRESTGPKNQKCFVILNGKGEFLMIYKTSQSKKNQKRSINIPMESVSKFKCDFANLGGRCTKKMSKK
jgi:hypothetical protein